MFCTLLYRIQDSHDEILASLNSESFTRAPYSFEDSMSAMFALWCRFIAGKQVLLFVYVPPRSRRIYLVFYVQRISPQHPISHNASAEIHIDSSPGEYKLYNIGKQTNVKIGNGYCTTAGLTPAPLFRLLLWNRCILLAS